MCVSERDTTGYELLREARDLQVKWAAPSEMEHPVVDTPPGGAPPIPNLHEETLNPKPETRNPKP